MNYIYDVLANFQEKYYDFFEWNKEDEITHIRKIPIITINDKLFVNMKNDDIKLSVDFLSKIENKTEVFKDKSIENILYASIFTNKKETIIVKFDSKGKNIYKSSMIIDEENEVLEDIDDYSIYNIDYEIVKTNIIEFNTRKQLQKIYKIKKEITKLYNNNDKEKLEYLYLECFNRKEKNLKRLKENIINSLEDSNILDTIEKFIKLISRV